MIEFIRKLEKDFDTEIIRSSEYSHRINSFDLDKYGNISSLYLYGISLRNVEMLLPLAEQLSDLSLEDCDLENLDAVKYFSGLKKLDLCFNPITTSTLESLGFLANLKDLRLDYTDIDDTSPLAILTSLEELHLSNCIDIEKVKGLEKLDSLNFLNLNSTYIESLENINVHDSIRSISLRDTAVDRISGLDRFPHLLELEITGQSISKIEGLEKSNSLKRLHLSTTCIKVIEGLEHLTNLEILDLHHNEIKKIEGLDTLLNLKKLNLSENEIRRVENLDKLTRLEYILLECSEIEEVDSRFLSNLNSPCYISLVGNPIIELNEPIPDQVEVKFEVDSWVPRGL
ncbi:MAG: leucine-rich repeat domain-containing protein [Psychroserpens sp.]|nr:leucine-rich repeat domain-containing protein [Psychroserpens sp.]